MKGISALIRRDRRELSPLSLCLSLACEDTMRSQSFANQEEYSYMMLD